MSAAHSDAIHGSDDGLGDVANDPMQPLDLECAPLGLAVAAGLGALLHIPAGTEGLVAGASEYDRGDFFRRPRGLERVDQLIDRTSAEGVIPVRPVDRDDSDFV